MIGTHSAWPRIWAAWAVALASTVGWAAEDPAPAPGSGEGYVQIAPQGYSFRGEQGFLQRYLHLDPNNENGVDRALEIFDQFGVALHAARPGAPLLELYHDNQFLLNDRWMGRWSPASGVRLEVGWQDYQRPLEKFLPVAAPGTVSYAQRFNDDFLAGDDLRRRRRDAALALYVRPASLSPSWSGLRALEVEGELARRGGQRQFMWVFGVVEDLVVPAGNNPARWRGRAEQIDQRVGRIAVGSTLALGEGNLTWLSVTSDRFDNRAPLVTNADVARFEPSVNTAPNTINFIADAREKSAQLVMEQRLAGPLLLLLDGSSTELKQDSLTPFQQAAVYEGRLRFTSLGAALHLNPNDSVSVEGFTRWSTRRNDTPVATAAVEPRHFLLQDRNLSGPFLRRTETSVWGATASWVTPVAVVRGGARWEDSEREFLYGIGANAIPPGLVGWGERSDPRTVWLSASSRPAQPVRWSARWEHRDNDHTFAPSDPARRQRLRASLGWTAKQGQRGVTVVGSWEDSENRQFAFTTPGRAAVDQRWDVKASTASLFGWSSLTPAVQLFAGAQLTRREQDSHLVLANVRRWREGWAGEVFDPAFGYESEARHLSVGAAVGVGERVTLIPALAFTDAEAGILSAKVPVRDFSLQDNRYLSGTVHGEYRFQRRSRGFLQYGYHRFDDKAGVTVQEGGDGRFHSVAAGYTLSF